MLFCFVSSHIELLSVSCVVILQLSWVDGHIPAAEVSGRHFSLSRLRWLFFISCMDQDGEGVLWDFLFLEPHSKNSVSLQPSPSSHLSADQSHAPQPLSCQTSVFHFILEDGMKEKNRNSLTWHALSHRVATCHREEHVQPWEVTASCFITGRTSHAHPWKQSTAYDSPWPESCA